MKGNIFCLEFVRTVVYSMQDGRSTVQSTVRVKQMAPETLPSIVCCGAAQSEGNSCSFHCPGDCQLSNSEEMEEYGHTVRSIY